jgi:hypothetical protein
MHVGLVRGLLPPPNPSVLGFLQAGKKNLQISLNSSSLHSWKPARKITNLHPCLLSPTPWQPDLRSAGAKYTEHIVFFPSYIHGHSPHPDATTGKWSTGKAVASSSIPMPHLLLLMFSSKESIAN